ncbi:MAG: O-antigen ligase family protein [Pseudomonadota bacterium]
MLSASIFLLAFLSACLLAVARHPIFGLLGYVLVYFVHPPTQWWGSYLPNLRWSLLAAGITAVSLVIHHGKLTTESKLINSVFVVMGLFIAWLGIQKFWALDQVFHAELLDFYVKYTIAMVLIYKSIDNEEHLKLFLWAHFLGCVYFGWNALFLYDGGRFERFGGPGFSDANYAGIQSVVAIYVAAGLFLVGNRWQRITIACLVPLIVNGLVTTASRSSFLAMIMGGIVFVVFSPKRYRAPAIALGIVGLLGFSALSHDAYWERISSILYAGEEVQGVDTGASRVAIWAAQVEMMNDYPLGCGHRCTNTLSPNYIEDRYLSGPPGLRGRSSHNTYLTILVEQGMVGGIFIALLLLWLLRTSLKLRKNVMSQDKFLLGVYPSAIAILSAFLVADMFVDYLKMEVRMWYIMMLLVILKIAKKNAETHNAEAPEPVVSSREIHQANPA